MVFNTISHSVFFSDCFFFCCVSSCLSRNSTNLFRLASGLCSSANIRSVSWRFLRFQCCQKRSSFLRSASVVQMLSKATAQLQLWKPRPQKKAQLGTPMVPRKSTTELKWNFSRFCSQPPAEMKLKAEIALSPNKSSWCCTHAVFQQSKCSAGNIHSFDFSHESCLKFLKHWWRSLSVSHFSFAFIYWPGNPLNSCHKSLQQVTRLWLLPQ